MEISSVGTLSSPAAFSFFLPASRRTSLSDPFFGLGASPLDSSEAREKTSSVPKESGSSSAFFVAAAWTLKSSESDSDDPTDEGSGFSGLLLAPSSRASSSTADSLKRKEEPSRILPRSSSLNDGSVL